MSIDSTVHSILNNIKKFWQEFDLKKWSEEIGGSSSQAVQAAVYFGLSFAIGFLFKKYFKFMFMCMVVSVFIILTLHYNNLVIIETAKIKALLGLGDTGGDMSVTINRFFDWIRDNLLLFIASIVGFFVGYKLG